MRTFWYKNKKIAIKISKLFYWMPDTIYLRIIYFMRLGKVLHLSNPKRFNEKIQWLKVYDRDEKYVELADKSLVKKHVAKMIGVEYIIPTLDIYDSFSEIDFDCLPDRFVLKCTHDSGGLIICKDKKKLNKVECEKKLSECLKKNYFYQNREWVYKNIKPRIIAEPYMEDENDSDLKDYKFMCFNGKCKCIFTCTERYSNDGLKVTFFDTDWNELPFERHYHKSKSPVKSPINLKKMISLAETLAQNIKFVRVDFYEINQKIYFGELTFYPGSGMEEFYPDNWDYILGDWIQL